MKYLEKLTLIRNEPISSYHFRMRLRSQKISSSLRPGQFVHLRISDMTDPLLRRPFSFADVGEGWFEIIYEVVGKGTKLMSDMRPGALISGLGPLGNGFYLTPLPDYALIAGGGAGVASLIMLARRMVELGVQTIFLIGARSADRLLCLEEIKSFGCEVMVATDDGTFGFKGTVPQLMSKIIDERKLDRVRTTIYACGPMPMLIEVAELRKGIPAFVSLESVMGCGLGACLGCVVPIRGGDYGRVCTEGPVFNVDRIDWDRIRRWMNHHGIGCMSLIEGGG